LLEGSVLFPIFVAQGKSKTRFKVGYISQDGRVVIDPIFEGGTLFYEGLASVRVKGGRWGVINSKGDFVIPPTLWNWCQFQEGLAGLASRTGKWGVIDVAGNQVVDPKYDWFQPFHEGLALVRVGSTVHAGDDARYCFIDRTGAETIPVQFHDAWDFSEGLAAVKVADKWGYIRLSGEFAITPRFDGTGKAKRGAAKRAGRFVGGLAPVWVGQDLYKFIDDKGSCALDIAFDDANSFSEGRAMVGLNGRYGYIDVQGRLAIDCRFTLARDFSDGLARVEQEESRAGFSPPSGFIDHDGQMVIAPTLYSAESFRGGMSLVTTEKSIGYINRTGDFVWQGPFVEYGVLF
jgi:hypothetical protein